jgi:hypothetical protein
MSNLKTEVRNLNVSIMGSSGFDRIPEKPTQEEENALIEFVVFIKTNFFPEGKFKMNWWALVTNPQIAKVLAKALPSIIKAIGKWIGL